MLGTGPRARIVQFGYDLRASARASIAGTGPLKHSRGPSPKAGDFQSSTLVLDIGLPVSWRYKGKDHEPSFLYRSRSEPRLHLLPVVRVEVRYERVDAPKSIRVTRPRLPVVGAGVLERRAMVDILLAPRPVTHRAHSDATL